MNWGEKYFGKGMDINNIFFIQITIDKNTGIIFRPNPFFISQEEL
jgi:hypothetical protein